MSQVFGTDTTSWAGLMLAPSLVAQLEGANFVKPTQCQQQAIPVLMAGRCGGAGGGEGLRKG